MHPFPPFYKSGYNLNEITYTQVLYVLDMPHNAEHCYSSCDTKSSKSRLSAIKHHSWGSMDYWRQLYPLTCSRISSIQRRKIGVSTSMVYSGKMKGNEINKAAALKSSELSIHLKMTPFAVSYREGILLNLGKLEGIISFSPTHQC